MPLVAGLVVLLLKQVQTVSEGVVVLAVLLWVVLGRILSMAEGVAVRLMLVLGITAVPLFMEVAEAEEAEVLVT